MKLEEKAKLPCGCVPDASGYGWCGECRRKIRKEIWENMSKERRWYDREFAPGESRVLDNECCSCHIHPPCSFCIERSKP